MTVLNRDFPSPGYSAALSRFSWGGKTTGGAKDMPFTIPSSGWLPPLLGLEVHDDQSDLPELLIRHLGSPDDLENRLERAANHPGVDFIALYIKKDETGWLGKFAKSTSLPLIAYVYGLGENNPEKLNKVAALLEGRSDYLGIAEEETYRTVGAAALAHGLGVVAQSPMDMNLAKQLNILLVEMGVPAERILMDPLPSSLGYGLQYTYTVSERLALAGLSGDGWCAIPIIGSAGEAWSGRECWSVDEARLGEVEKRAVLWEAITALAMMTAGASVLHLRHPTALDLTKALLNDYTGDER